MRYSSQQYARALYKAMKNSSSDSDKIIENFVKILKKHEVLYKGNSILKAYRTILIKNNELPEVILTCASNVSSKTIEEVLKTLNINNEVKLRLRIDDKMIGGAFVKYNNRLFDLSLSRRLARLKRQLLVNSTK